MAIVFPQAFAPAFVTSTFAWSIKLKILGGNTIWIILGVICELKFSKLIPLPTDARTYGPAKCCSVIGSSAIAHAEGSFI